MYVYMLVVITIQGFAAVCISISMFYSAYISYRM